MSGLAVLAAIVPELSSELAPVPFDVRIQTVAEYYWGFVVSFLILATLTIAVIEGSESP